MDLKLTVTPELGVALRQNAQTRPVVAVQSAVTEFAKSLAPTKGGTALTKCFVVYGVRDADVNRFINRVNGVDGVLTVTTHQPSVGAS